MNRIETRRVELRETFLFALSVSDLDTAIDAVISACLGDPPKVIRGPQLVHLLPLRLVAEHYGITPERLLSEGRRGAETRWVAAWLLRQRNARWSQMSFPQIARALNLRNHTTVIHGVLRVQGCERMLNIATALLAKSEAVNEEAAA